MKSFYKNPIWLITLSCLAVGIVAIASSLITISMLSQKTKTTDTRAGVSQTKTQPIQEQPAESTPQQTTASSTTQEATTPQATNPSTSSSDDSGIDQLSDVDKEPYNTALGQLNIAFNNVGQSVTTPVAITGAEDRLRLANTSINQIPGLPSGYSSSVISESSNLKNYLTDAYSRLSNALNEAANYDTYTDEATSAQQSGNDPSQYQALANQAHTQFYSYFDIAQDDLAKASNILNQ